MSGEDDDCTFEHLMSIIFLVNIKFRESVQSMLFLYFRKSDTSSSSSASSSSSSSSSSTSASDGVEDAAGSTKFERFFTKALALRSKLEAEGTWAEKTAYLIFMINCFQSLEEKSVRACALRLLGLPLWANLSEARRERELRTFPQLKRHWAHLEASEATKTSAGKKGKKGAAAADDGSSDALDRTFVCDLLRHALATIEGAGASPQGADDHKALRYGERVMELVIDLLSQLPTRRFFCAVLDDLCFLERCRSSALGLHQAARQAAAVSKTDAASLGGAGAARGTKEDRASRHNLFIQLVDMASYYLRFEIDDHTGHAVSPTEMQARHYARINVLQRVAFKYFSPALDDLALSNIGGINTADALRAHLGVLPAETLCSLGARLRLWNEDSPLDPTLMLSKLVQFHEARDSQVDEINQLPLLPDEKLLWDPNLVPMGDYDGDSVLALPKLNLQFLTFHDYLMRSFKLFRQESAYEVRGDMVDAVRRVAPAPDAHTGRTNFTGWARMAVPVDAIEITKVAQPKLGEMVPAEVVAEVTYGLEKFGAAQSPVRQEWDELREHDIVFLLCLRPQSDPRRAQDDEGGRRGGKGARKGPRDEEDPLFPRRYGLDWVRGGEIVEVRDGEGGVLNDFSGKPENRDYVAVGDSRTLKVRLDAAQYQKDMAGEARGEPCDAYDSINLLVRRKGKENNFKAILTTIRDLMNVAAVGNAVPDWLHDVFLGYGNPGAAHYSAMMGPAGEGGEGGDDEKEGEGGEGGAALLNMKDTFVDASHAVACLRGAAKTGRKVVLLDEDGKRVADKDQASVLPPFRVTFPRAVGRLDEVDADSSTACTVQPYKLVNRGPYPENKPRLNSVPFTTTQVEAIRSGMHPGLTMVVGPPGTGKTDVAVQIISNLYANFPEQRTLLVTHSNQALNDLFEKIMARDIDERHLLRLGRGEKDLETDKDFSKHGRVNYCLARRLELLSEVERLAVSLDVAGDVGYTCETAGHFHQHHVRPHLEKFTAAMDKAKGGEAGGKAGVVADEFPFGAFFANAVDEDGGELLPGVSFATDLDVAEGCFRHVEGIFKELDEYRAFELLRSGRQRGNYLLTKQARIIAMTCTHAALVRSQLVEMGFKYDNIVMEEAAQILEIETFIPMLLQNHDSVEGCRLKRVVLIGDHHQLPPVVQNMAFQKYGHLDQSLFARFVRLGTPTVQLNAQGRCRPSIARLFSWRYESLGNLPATLTGPYGVGNAGFSHTHQIIDVQDFQGKGESSPSAHFYQNLGEAEYIVAVYQYMRLLGYPAERIAVLTTYNGQKHLLRDVFQQRCGREAHFGMPATIATVDRYQGQQNDFVLLSLVKTVNVGHIRDVRRLVVALSRARLGLYVFCRHALFANCYELTPAFNQLSELPTSMELVPGEAYGTCQRPACDSLDGKRKAAKKSDKSPEPFVVQVSRGGGGGEGGGGEGEGGSEGEGRAEKERRCGRGVVEVCKWCNGSCVLSMCFPLTPSDSNTRPCLFPLVCVMFSFFLAGC